MNMTRNSTIALIILALAGCASERSGEPSGSSSTSSNTPSDTSSYTPGSSGSGSQSNQSSTTGTMTSGSSGTAATGGASSGSGMSGSGSGLSTSGAMASSSQSAQTSYGVVQAIDQMQRQDVGVGSAGAAAAGGSVGMPTDKVYRVTVRMDDGSNQMVVVDSMPSYKIGDRVRYNNGTLSNY